MPFTPSHAVVALPFVRTPLVPAAIAVGAMTPDLPLFLRGTPLSYQLTHTNVALSVVIAFALLALWYFVLRPAVRELSPTWLATRLPGEWDAAGAAAWNGWCEAAGVTSQEFVSNNAVPCGSTIGPITATRLGIRTVDVGIPILSMHSARELAGVSDLYDLSRVAETFFRA